MEHYLGIDLGATHIAAGIVDGEHRIMKKSVLTTDRNKSFAGLMGDLVTVSRRALAKAGMSVGDIAGAGIGSPGIVDPEKGIVIYSNNLRWHDVPLAEELTRRLGVPTKADNDAHCAVLGELLAGAARGYRNIVMLTLGTGVGGAVVVDGRIFGGTGSMGAELGHSMLIAGGEPCPCGRSGCLETYASGDALTRDAKRAALLYPASLLAALGQANGGVTSKTAFEAARSGDKTALEVVRRYASYVAEGITDLINIFRPELVIIGGGIGEQGEFLLNPIREQVNRSVLHAARLPAPDIVSAQRGNDAGIIGAASLVMPHVRSKTEPQPAF